MHGIISVQDDAIINGCNNISGDILIADNAKINGIGNNHGVLMISGNLCFMEDAYIETENDFISVTGFGSENRTTIFYRTNCHGIVVDCGCYNGTLKRFKRKVLKTYGLSKYGRAYLAVAKAVELQFKRNGVI